MRYIVTFEMKEGQQIALGYARSAVPCFRRQSFRDDKKSAFEFFERVLSICGEASMKVEDNTWSL